MNITISIILSIIAIVLFVTPIRRAVVTRFLLQAMKKKMPAISATEQEAIDAGTVWWEKSLLRGVPNWSELSQVKSATLNAEEKTFIDGPVETLCNMVDDWQTHQDGDLSLEVWNYLKEQRFFGMGIPRSYGGLEFSATGHSEVIQKIASRSVTAAVTTMVPNSLGPAELLLHYGTTEQKDYYLPRLACGEEVPCFALTAPDAGSDAGSIPDIGIVEKGIFEGEEVLGIRLNWNKRYITLSPVATLIGLAFRLYDPNHLLGEQEDIGITVGLIPSDTAGVTVGRRHNPLYVPFQNGPTQGKDVFIPLSAVVGGVEYVGQGWRMLMESLAAGRAISLPALSCGTGKLACRATSAYVKVREQFGLPIGRFEGVSERMANIVISTYTVNAVRQLSARAVDLGERPSVLSAIAKYNTTESMRRVINDAMDIVGGKGICAGPSNLLAHTYMSIPIGITVEGANILTRSLIIFGQGAIRCNPYILAEIEAINHPDPKQSLYLFDRALFGHVGSFIKGVFRSLRFTLFGGFLSSTPVNTKLSSLYQQINRLSAFFATVADFSMVTLGGKLKIKESLSGRLADAFSALYQASAVLKLHHDRGEPKEEQLIVKAAVITELVRAEVAIDGVLRNFPMPWLAKLLRVIILPFGVKRQAPSDDILHAVTKSVMNEGSPRDLLTGGIYLPQGENEALQQLESAMHATLATDTLRADLKQQYGSNAMKPAEIRQTIAKALEEGRIDADERVKLDTWLHLRSQVINVDDFAQGEIL